MPHPYQNQIRVAVHPLLPSPGYVWIFSKGEYYLNIGIGWLLNPKNEDINIQKRMEKIYHELFPNTEIVEKGGGFLPGRLPYYTLVANGFMCCGDSAAVVDPINGGGHAQAIVSGYYAGETILDAFKQNKFDEQTLWSYNKKVWDDFGIESALGVCVHKFLEKTSFQELSFLIEDKIISQELVQELILESSTKPPIFSIFFKCLKKPKLLYYTIKTFLLSARIKKHINKYPKSINEFEKWVKKIEKLENKKL